MALRRFNQRQEGEGDGKKREEEEPLPDIIGRAGWMIWLNGSFRANNTVSIAEEREEKIPFFLPLTSSCFEILHLLYAEIIIKNDIVEKYETWTE